MHIITGKHLDRRTVLRGMGATVALPFLDAMLPARKWKPDKTPTRLVCIEMSHGSAGSNLWGESQNMWAPAATGDAFDLTPSAILPLERYRDYLTIVSNSDCKMAEAFAPKEIGGDHFRSTAVFLTQSHCKQTQGSDVHAGTSLDQLYAQRFGQDTPIPSMQLCIENINQSGGCAYGYTCVYTDTLSWASPTDPLPVIRDPRVAFERLFGGGSTPEQRASRRRTNRSILDWISDRVGQLQGSLGAADRDRLNRYLDNVREIERRIQKVEEQNQQPGKPLPEAPTGIPESYAEHVQLMFDLQTLAFASDVTRVFSFKMSRDSSARVFPESGVNRPFHPCSHHGGREKGVTDFYNINKYHVSLLPYFLDKLKETEDGETHLLDQTMILYGSAMGDSNLHNHKKCPFFVVGGAGGTLEGNRHLRAPDGEPMANVMLSLLHKLGLDDLERFGNSTKPYAI